MQCPARGGPHGSHETSLVLSRSSQTSAKRKRTKHVPPPFSPVLGGFNPAIRTLVSTECASLVPLVRCGATRVWREPHKCPGDDDKLSSYRGFVNGGVDMTDHVEFTEIRGKPFVLSPNFSNSLDHYQTFSGLQASCSLARRGPGLNERMNDIGGGGPHRSKVPLRRYPSIKVPFHRQWAAVSHSSALLKTELTRTCLGSSELSAMVVLLGARRC